MKNHRTSNTTTRLKKPRNFNVESSRVESDQKTESKSLKWKYSATQHHKRSAMEMPTQTSERAETSQPERSTMHSSTAPRDSAIGIGIDFEACSRRKQQRQIARCIEQMRNYLVSAGVSSALIGVGDLTAGLVAYFGGSSASRYLTAVWAGCLFAAVNGGLALRAGRCRRKPAGRYRSGILAFVGVVTITMHIGDFATAVCGVSAAGNTRDWFLPATAESARVALITVMIALDLVLLFVATRLCKLYVAELKLKQVISASQEELLSRPQFAAVNQTIHFADSLPSYSSVMENTPAVHSTAETQSPPPPWLSSSLQLPQNPPPYSDFI